MKNKYIKNVKINNEFVIKKYNKNVLNVYEILSTSSFDNYPKIIEYDESNIKYEYIENTKYYEKTKGEEFIKLVSLLHSKTLFIKEIPHNKYKNIYDKLNNNISYLSSYYESMIDSIENEEYMSPSHYLFARNYSLIDSSLKYSKEQLNKWYKSIENNTSERVCVVHNNLSLSHYIKNNNKDYLISFENSIIDTPVLDLYKFYKSEGHKLNFNYLFKTYSNNFSLLDHERILFNILISIPYKIEEVDDEFLNTVSFTDLITYLEDTLKFINENNNLH